MEILFAQDAGQTAPQGSLGNFTTIIMMVAIFAVFYFLLIRPQQKRQKELQRQIQEIKNGDDIITAGGIKGKVVETKQDSVIVLTQETKVEILKPYIAQVLKK